MPRIEEADDLDGGPGYPVITGDYRGAAAWERRPVAVGTPVAKPTPVFTKLDPSVVEEELARLSGAVA
jgi:methionyl-tRNA synthetase